MVSRTLAPDSSDLATRINNVRLLGGYQQRAGFKVFSKEQELTAGTYDFKIFESLYGTIDLEEAYTAWAPAATDFAGAGLYPRFTTTPVTPDNTTPITTIELTDNCYVELTGSMEGAVPTTEFNVSETTIKRGGDIPNTRYVPTSRNFGQLEFELHFDPRVPLHGWLLSQAQHAREIELLLEDYAQTSAGEKELDARVSMNLHAANGTRGNEYQVSDLVRSDVNDAKPIAFSSWTAKGFVSNISPDVSTTEIQKKTITIHINEAELKVGTIEEAHMA